MIRAQLYQLLVHNLSFDIDVYTQSLLNETDPVLDLGCGTGRTLIPLAQRGIPCVGIDNDQEMIDFCTIHKQEDMPLTLLHADICSFALEMRFQQIQVSLRSMQILTTQQRIQALARIREHLQEKGHAIFHISTWNPQDLDHHWKLYSLFPASDGGEVIIEECTYEENPRESDRIMHILHRFQHFASNHLLQSTHMLHQKIHHIPNFSTELQEAGFHSSILTEMGQERFFWAQKK